MAFIKIGDPEKIVTIIKSAEEVDEEKVKQALVEHKNLKSAETVPTVEKKN